MKIWDKIKQLWGSDKRPADHPKPDASRLTNPAMSNPILQPVGRFADPPPPTPKEAAAQAKWLRGMPIILQDYWDDMRTDVDTVDYNQMRLDLMGEYRRPDEMALALFNWYGHGVSDWSEAPAYESVAEQLLWELPMPILIKALEDHPLDATHLEGAARLLSGDVFVGSRGQELPQIPADVGHGLLNHLAENKDIDKIQRLKRALGL